MTAALAQHVRVSQSSSSRGNMNRCSAGKVEATHLEDPTRGVPGPAGDGIVDKGRPNEHVDDARQHASTLCYCTNGKSNTGIRSALMKVDAEDEIYVRDSGEHALVHTEHQVRNSRASNRWSTKDIHQTKVVKISDVLSCSMRESQGITPEEPLEADDCRSHNRQP